MTATLAPVSHRDRAVLRAAAQGRVVVRAGALMIDGRYSADQFALARLRAAGLLSGADTPTPTPAGEHALRAA